MILFASFFPCSDECQMRVIAKDFRLWDQIALKERAVVSGHQHTLSQTRTLSDSVESSAHSCHHIWTSLSNIPTWWQEVSSKAEREKASWSVAPLRIRSPTKDHTEWRTVSSIQREHCSDPRKGEKVFLVGKKCNSYYSPLYSNTFKIFLSYILTRCFITSKFQ